MKIFTICLSLYFLETLVAGHIIPKRHGLERRSDNQTTATATFTTSSIVLETPTTTRFIASPTTSVHSNTTTTSSSSTTFSLQSSTTNSYLSNIIFPTQIATIGPPTNITGYAKPYLTNIGASNGQGTREAGAPFTIEWATTTDSQDAHYWSTCYEFVIALVNNTNTSMIHDHAYALPTLPGVPPQVFTIQNNVSETQGSVTIPKGALVEGLWAVRLQYNCANASVTPHLDDYTFNATASPVTPETQQQFWMIIAGCIVGACLIAACLIFFAVRAVRAKRSKLHVDENTIYELHAANALHELSPACVRKLSPTIQVYDRGTSRVDSFDTVQTTEERRGKIFFELEASEPSTPLAERSSASRQRHLDGEVGSEPPTPSIPPHIRALASEMASGRNIDHL